MDFTQKFVEAIEKATREVADKIVSEEIELAQKRIKERLTKEGAEIAVKVAAHISHIERANQISINITIPSDNLKIR